MNVMADDKTAHAAPVDSTNAGACAGASNRPPGSGKHQMTNLQKKEVVSWNETRIQSLECDTRRKSVWVGEVWEAVNELLKHLEKFEVTIMKNHGQLPLLTVSANQSFGSRNFKLFLIEEKRWLQWCQLVWLSSLEFITLTNLNNFGLVSNEEHDLLLRIHRSEV